MSSFNQFNRNRIVDIDKLQKNRRLNVEKDKLDKNRVNETHQANDTLEEQILRLKDRIGTLSQLKEIYGNIPDIIMQQIIDKEAFDISKIMQDLTLRYNVSVVDILGKIGGEKLRSDIINARENVSKAEDGGENLFDLVNEEQQLIDKNNPRHAGIIDNIENRIGRKYEEKGLSAEELKQIQKIMNRNGLSKFKYVKSKGGLQTESQLEQYQKELEQAEEVGEQREQKAEEENEKNRKKEKLKHLLKGALLKKEYNNKVQQKYLQQQLAEEEHKLAEGRRQREEEKKLQEEENKQNLIYEQERKEKQKYIDPNVGQIRDNKKEEQRIHDIIDFSNNQQTIAEAVLLLEREGFERYNTKKAIDIGIKPPFLAATQLKYLDEKYYHQFGTRAEYKGPINQDLYDLLKQTGVLSHNETKHDGLHVLQKKTQYQIQEKINEALKKYYPGQGQAQQLLQQAIQPQQQIQQQQQQQ